MDFQKILDVLRLDEYEIFPAVINYLEFSSFMYLVGFLSNDDIRKMAYAKKGLAFKTMTGNNCCREFSGRENLRDFREKAKFFLEIDKFYFQELFFSESFTKESITVKMTFECLLKEMDVKEKKKFGEIEEKYPSKEL